VSQLTPLSRTAENGRSENELDSNSHHLNTKV